MKRRMTEAKTGSGEERECLKILQSETVIVLRHLYLSSNTRPGESHSNKNSPKSLTFNLSIWVASHFFSNIVKTWPVGLQLKRALNQELEIMHANFECQKWAAQSWNQPGPWGWEIGFCCTFLHNKPVKFAVNAAVDVWQGQGHPAAHESGQGQFFCCCFYVFTKPQHLKQAKKRNFLNCGLLLGPGERQV